MTAQVALTLVLLVAAGLFVRTLQNLGRVELGLKPDGLLGFTVAPELNGYTAERTSAMGRALIESLSALPGVRSATAAELPTLANETRGSNVRVEGLEADADTTHVQVNDGRLRTTSRPSAFRSSWGGSSPGKTTRTRRRSPSSTRRWPGSSSRAGARSGEGSGSLTAGRPSRISRSSASSATARRDTVDKETGPFAYLPWQQNPKLGQLTFYVRSSEAPESLAPAIRAAVARIDPQLPVFDVKTLAHPDLRVAARAAARDAAVGGLRRPGGASRGARHLRRARFRRSAAAPGDRRPHRARRDAVRRASARPLRGRRSSSPSGASSDCPRPGRSGTRSASILFGVPAADVPIFAGGVVLLALVALSAAYPPARRAARTDAIDALRSE